MTDPTKTAEALTPFAHIDHKPVLASWMGGERVHEGADALRKARIPTFDFPDTAARMFTFMWQYAQTLQGLYETPTPVAVKDQAAVVLKARKIIEQARRAGRTILTEIESKSLLRLYGIPVTETLMARTASEAVAIAKKLGFPVVLKLHSLTITHKTDVGGVQLDLQNPTAVRNAFHAIRRAVTERASAKAFGGVTVQPMVRPRDAYELILGSSFDVQFGPALLFGSGGQMVEVYRDKALGLPPLNTTLARRLMERTKIFHALQGVRGRKPIDLKALEKLLVFFSQIVVDHPRIKEMDLNPLLVSPEGMITLDARVVLHDPAQPDDALPKPAIRPYPASYASPFKLRDGRRVMIRPIRHQDEPLMVKFHQALSQQSIYLRYFQVLQLDERVTHERLLRRCFIDYDREMALVAEGRNATTGETELLGVARMIKQHGTSDAELAVLVSDSAQRQGLGRQLLKRLVAIAQEERISRLQAKVLPDNEGMRRLLTELHFTFKPAAQDPMTLQAERQLK